jgi:hypothetical protein
MKLSTRAIERGLCSAIDHVLLHRSRTSHSCRCGYRIVWNELEPGQCPECDEATLKALPQADQFRFDPLEHRYFLGQRELPAVSRILDAVFPWEGPVDNFYLNRGTAVHLACELDDLGELDEDKLDEELWPYLEAWRSFRKSSGFVPDPDGIEQRRYHAWLFYAGTIDRVGRLRSGRKIVIDIKTGGKYPRYRLQLAAYVNLLSNPMDYLRGSVTLDPDGSPSFDEYPPLTTQEGAEDLAIFRSVLNLYGFKKKYGI